MSNAAEVIELWRHINAPRATFHCGECEGDQFEITRFKHDPSDLRVICSLCRNHAVNLELVEVDTDSADA